MRAIPKSFLIHTVMLYRPEKEDRWGNGATGEGTELSQVRMEPCSKIVRDKNNAEVQLSATLFIDYKNTRPKRVTIKKDDIVAFNGERYKVQLVEPLYDNKRLHHYEVGLIKGV
ncbi:MAG: putative minor capsid protein [Blautia hansenii]|jgi:hypothetical protein|nr:putative minor capsid protein [Blautia hansenii]MEE0656458.1 putative minor capsid protein [Blautia hansenii]